MINTNQWKDWEVVKKEGDLHQWTDTATKYHCMIMRNPHLGFWLGYVDIPEQHRCFGKHYDKLNLFGLSVHGGLTYSDMVELEGKKGTFWRLGFDCGHAGDYVPALSMAFDNEVYQTKEYVIREVTSLALQLYTFGNDNGSGKMNSKKKSV